MRGILELNGLDQMDGIPGALDIGDGVGTAIDTVVQHASDRIANSATVSVFSTGAWNLTDHSTGDGIPASSRSQT